MSILYRPARADELATTQEHIVRSINDLSERHGFGSMASVRTPDFQLFSLENDPADLRELAVIDASALGFSREKHHKFLIGDAATKGFLLFEGEGCVGYVYVNLGGHVGPFAVVRSDVAGAAFITALHLAAESGAPHVSAFIPGVSEAQLGIAAAHGMRITFPLVLMSSHAFGDWRRYMPSNPGFR